MHALPAPGLQPQGSLCAHLIVVSEYAFLSKRAFAGLFVLSTAREILLFGTTFLLLISLLDQIEDAALEFTV